MLFMHPIEVLLLSQSIKKVCFLSSDLKYNTMTISVGTGNNIIFRLALFFCFSNSVWPIDMSIHEFRCIFRWTFF